MMRLGILGSTNGSNLDMLLQASKEKKLSADIAIVLSNKQEAGILEKAKKYGLIHQYVPTLDLTREQYDTALSGILKQQQVDLIVLIGFMRILSAHFVNVWRDKIINIHPSLLPKYKGLMDLAVHQAVLDAGDQYTGCTVHYVSEEVDAGAPILQKQCVVLQNDTVASLKSRVQRLEAEALVAAINLCALK